MIDIAKQLKIHNVHYVTEGPNVAKGNINIQCPWCGDKDPSEHLGINLRNGKFGCWRNQSHRGRNLGRLFRLLRIPLDGIFTGDLEKLANGTLFKFEEQPAVAHIKCIELPDSFKTIGDGGIDKHYKMYLNERGFHADPTIIDYDLRRCMDTRSKWWDRLIIPIYVGDEVSWTARALSKFNKLRYLSPDKTEARNIKHCLFGFNELALSEGKWLVITEGPFDSLKLDAYSSPNLRATCLFGASISIEQLSLFKLIADRYDQLVVALDADALAQSMTVVSKLSSFMGNKIKLVRIASKKDFGEMAPEEIREFESSL